MKATKKAQQSGTMWDKETVKILRERESEKSIPAKEFFKKFWKKIDSKYGSCTN
jgi:hypothetical protein